MDNVPVISGNCDENWGFFSEAEMLSAVRFDEVDLFGEQPLREGSLLGGGGSVWMRACAACEILSINSWRMV